MPGNMIASRTGCALCNNLGQRKIEQQTPIPSEIKDEAAQKPKRAILSFLIRGEMGAGSKFSICFVQDCSSTMMYDFTGFEKLRFRPSTRKQKDGDFKNLQLLTISDFKNTRIRVSGRGLRVICHPSDMLCISVQPIWRHICV